jgi:hypothetical protein
MSDRVIEYRIYELKGLGLVPIVSFLDFVHNVQSGPKTQDVAFQALIVGAIDALVPASSFGLDVIAAPDLLVWLDVHPLPEVWRAWIEDVHEGLVQVKSVPHERTDPWDAVGGLSTLESAEQADEAFFSVRNDDEISASQLHHRFRYQACP